MTFTLESLDWMLGSFTFGRVETVGEWKADGVWRGQTRFCDGEFHVRLLQLNYAARLKAFAFAVSLQNRDFCA